ncbi:sensor histidine kinase [Kitasatospora nipponensis]|uniref:histidine kinase n=1 Tax=Kitasatospora nipponensis TaxID=258049 RepID=A0ABP4GB32_9ACTN
MREGLRRGAAHQSVAWLTRDDHEDGSAPADADGAHHAPRRPSAVREALLVAAGIPFALPLLLLLAAAGSNLYGPFVALLLVLVEWLTALQRSRLRALGGLEIPERPPVAPAQVRGPRRLGAWLRTESTWRQFGYHLVASPMLACCGLLALLVWGGALTLTTVLGWAWLMPLGSRVRSGPWMAADVLLTVVGVLLLFLTPWLLGGLARLERRAARALLGPNRAHELARRVEDLAESRAGVVDAADAERRRIERDLHDGAQQRLVSLAMNLGLARKTLKDVSPEAMRVIVEAHEEAQAAIVELRDLVRGLHPVVLEDRGLDAALSGIAARAPLPVRLDVSLPDRVAPTVEAVAYFVVSEALANVAKHARASKVTLSVRQVAARLRIVLVDDGVGGADPSRGTGLHGLRKRAASVDGTLAISSPLGGPTTITVELPCEL